MTEPSVEVSGNGHVPVDDPDVAAFTTDAAAVTERLRLLVAAEPDRGAGDWFTRGEDAPQRAQEW